MSRAKRWIFTLNNYTEDDIERLRGLHPEHATYITFGYETAPTTGTPHLQGFVIFRERKRLSQAKEFIGVRAFCEMARGTAEANREYCQKDGLFEEEGGFEELPSRGQDGQIRQFTVWFEAFVRDEGRVPTEREWFVAYPALAVRYPNGMKELVKHLSPEVELELGTLKPWQSDLETILVGDSDDRTVMFFVDPEGGAGKTFFQRWMMTKYPNQCQVLSSGRRDDIAHAINENCRCFMFNIPRGGMEYLQYGILEQLKDRMVFSPKYNSRTKLFRSMVHVVVFCNEEPDLNKMTTDRYFIHRLS